MTSKQGIYSTANHKYQLYKRSAADRGIDFDLDFDLFAEIIQQNCYYCGAPPSNKHIYSKSGDFRYYSGVDRVDNTKGYAANNVVPCCKKCNTTKSATTKEKFLRHAVDGTFLRRAREYEEWAHRLYRHQTLED